MNKILGKADILQAQDLQIELVDVPEWDGQVYVRCLTGAERDRFEEGSLRNAGSKAQSVVLANMRARLCALAICDENGARLFSDSDVAKLGEKSAQALNRVFEAAARLSGITQQDIEDLSKNSGEAQGGVSSTA